MSENGFTVIFRNARLLKPGPVCAEEGWVVLFPDVDKVKLLDRSANVVRKRRLLHGLADGRLPDDGLKRGVRHLISTEMRR